MNKKNKRKLAWGLILVTAFYIGYHALTKVMANNSDITHWYVLIAVILWLVGDYLLSET